jgi:hypothetical protein
MSILRPLNDREGTVDTNEGEFALPGPSLPSRPRLVSWVTQARPGQLYSLLPPSNNALKATQDRKATL